MNTGSCPAPQGPNPQLKGLGWHNALSLDYRACASQRKKKHRARDCVNAKIKLYLPVSPYELSEITKVKKLIYESLNPTYSKGRSIELRQNAHYELDKLIDQWKAQKQEREDARNNRALRKKHRTAKQREMDKKRKQRERELQKSIERLITARHSG